MMRKRKLPQGWYPASQSETIEELSNFIKAYAPPTETGVSVVVPHAGWAFSGDLAYKTISTLEDNPHLVVVVGGHLPTGKILMAAVEESYETPLGPLVADKEFLEELSATFKAFKDDQPDNTTETLFPMIKYRFPESKAIALRVSPDSMAKELGAFLHTYASEQNKRVRVVGSTDLTHYGPNYRFEPAGTGPEAYEYAKQQDEQILSAMKRMEVDRVELLANQNHAACSAGGAIAAIEFAKLEGRTEGVFIGYKNSYEKIPGTSFVGYGGVSY